MPLNHKETLRILTAAGVTAWLVSAGVAARSGGLYVEQAAQGTPSPSTSAAPASPARALVNRYCVTCHNERRPTPPGAPLMLDKLNIDHVGDNAEIWEKVARKVRSGAMPPVGLPRPDGATFRTWVEGLETALDKAAAERPRVGRPAPVHRLNRAEYANAVRDLLGLEIQVRDLLPADDSGYGFDNIGDVLSVSPGLLERYMLAAAKITRQTLGDPTLRPTTTSYKVSPLLLQTSRMNEDLPFGSRGGIAVRHHFPLDAEYAVKIDLSRNLDGGQIRGVHEMEVRLDRALVKRLTVDASKGMGSGKAPIEVRFPAKAGTRLVSVSFVGSVDQMLPRDGRPSPPPPTAFAFQLYPIDAAVNNIQVVGPFDGQVPEHAATRERIFICRPAPSSERSGAGLEGPRKRSEPSGAKGSPREENDERGCARRIVSALARRAYRRPVTDADLRPLLAAYAAGRQKGSFDQGIEWAVEAVLVSPKFLFRVEQDPAGAVPGQVTRLTQFELASRLSFFLWSSIPDEELLTAAERGRLTDPVVLEQQVRRMLADPRASALVTNFGGQWLWLRNLRTAAPNADLFAEFDDNLRDAFRQETELFLADQLQDDRSLVELLTANYTFLNERLARHYGIPNVYGSHFRRVNYPDDRRAGLLGHGSILTVTAYSNRTSPVVRGKWLLENLLGAPPPPPPPNVPALKENGEGGKPTTVRERMEAHRNNPACASCHAQMDPLGFALENFDAVGKWRTVDAEAQTPIDASGRLIDGQTFDGPAAFRRLLVARQYDFVTTLTEKLLTYALGRGVEYYDRPVVRQILRNAAPSDYRWSSVILGIVKSAPFEQRQAGEPSATRSVGQ
jgi:mono/diheme cytochrome c family protein